MRHNARQTIELQLSFPLFEALKVRDNERQAIMEGKTRD